MATAESAARIPTPWLTTEEAAEYLSSTGNTLRQWRSNGEGPKYCIVKSRLVRYHVNDLDAFVRGESKVEGVSRRKDGKAAKAVAPEAANDAVAE